jgi:hypothetical protein
MRTGRRGQLGTQTLLRFISAALIIYGALGVAATLRLLPLAAAGLSAWLGLPAPSAETWKWDLLGPLQSHFDTLPWLPWAAWLVGVALQVRTPADDRRQTTDDNSSPSSVVRRPSSVVCWTILLSLLALAFYARMAELWPQSYGLAQFPYDDEGVYAGASQLLLQGILPYRDYFFAHPPLAAISYAPAMAYHFTEWGSPTSFMMARYLSVGYSLATLALVFLIGRQLGGAWGGAISGALWAIDGRVVEINRKVMLDGPMVLLSCAAILLYLWARPVLSGDTARRGPTRPLLVLALAGALGALSALTKLAGVACLLAIMTDLLWMHLNNRRTGLTLAPLWAQLYSALGGALAAGLAVAGPFLLASPSGFTRQVLFFQLLRPSDGLVDVPARIADLTATFANALTPLMAASGFLALSVWVWVSSRDRESNNPTTGGPWRVIVLWTFLSLLLFTYSRSFYSHYYIQLAAPLCLLGAGTAYLPGLIRTALARTRASASTWPRFAGAALLALLALVALPLVAVQWSGVISRHEDRIFEIVARYVGDAVPPGTAVLTTDEQFNFLAARPPSRSSTGYLVDSYGHMIYLGLGLDTRDWGDLAAAALRGEHGSDAYAVLQRPRAQSDFLDRASHVPLIVLHQKGLPRLTPDTVSKIESLSLIAERQPRYTIYRVINPQAGR